MLLHIRIHSEILSKANLVEPSNASSQKLVHDYIPIKYTTTSPQRNFWLKLRLKLGLETIWWEVQVGQDWGQTSDPHQVWNINLGWNLHPNGVPLLNCFSKGGFWKNIFKDNLWNSFWNGTTKYNLFCKIWIYI